MLHYNPLWNYCPIPPRSTFPQPWNNIVMVVQLQQSWCKEGGGGGWVGWEWIKLFGFFAEDLSWETFTTIKLPTFPIWFLHMISIIMWTNITLMSWEKWTIFSLISLHLFGPKSSIKIVVDNFWAAAILVWVVYILSTFFFEIANFVQNTALTLNKHNIREMTQLVDLCTCQY